MKHPNLRIQYFKQLNQIRDLINEEFEDEEAHTFDCVDEMMRMRETGIIPDWAWDGRAIDDD
jgi:hypothetical protein